MNTLFLFASIIPLARLLWRKAINSEILSWLFDDGSDAEELGLLGPRLGP